MGQQRFLVSFTSPFAFSSPSSSPHRLFLLSQLLLLTIMDDDRDGSESEAFSVCSSPLSIALDTTVLEVSFHATDGNTLSFNSEQSNGDYARVDGKTYLAVDRRANLRKGVKPSWI